MSKIHMPDLSLRTVLLILIGLTCLLVTVSYLVYANDENYKYDIARPGDKSRSKELSVNDDEVNDTTSLVDKAVVIEKQTLLEVEVKNLDQLNSFDDKPVSNKSMQLDPGVTPAL